MQSFLRPTFERVAAAYGLKWRPTIQATDVSLLDEANRLFKISLSDLPRNIGEMWSDLSIRADVSFFTSWSWMAAWIKSHAAEFGETSSLRLLAAAYDGRVVGMAIVGVGMQKKLSRRSYFLHQSGAASDEARYIEYNDILLDRAAPPQTRTLMLEFLINSGAEVRIAAATSTCTHALTMSDLCVRAEGVRLCPWVPLGNHGNGLDAYLATLSRNTRQQIRRSARLIAAAGPFAVARASTITEARQFLADLRSLHEARWRKQNGTAGAFSWSGFAPFVESIIERETSSGGVDVLRVTAGSTLIGVLLNFICDDHVYAYLSGFAYQDDNRIRPGLVSHTLAIVHYRDRGCRAYHFMAGEGRYKSSLGTATEELTWLTVRQNNIRAWIEDGLHALKGALVQLCAR